MKYCAIQDVSIDMRKYLNYYYIGRCPISMNQLDWTSSLIRKKLGLSKMFVSRILYLRLKLKMLIVEYSKRAFNSFKSTEVVIYLRVFDIQVKKELVYLWLLWFPHSCEHICGQFYSLAIVYTTSIWDIAVKI